MYVQIYLYFTVNKMYVTFEKHIVCETFENTPIPQQYGHKVNKMI